MRIGVVGNGVVGSATGRSFVEHAEVRYWDKVKEKSTHTLEDVLACDLVFVCLPTPQKNVSGECDTSIVENFFRIVPERETKFVLRSTVPVGFTRATADKYRLNIVHSPEFLTARCSFTDAQTPARNIVGFPFSEISALSLVDLYERRFQGVPVHVMTSDESEAVKLLLNSFFAVKVAYWNEAHEFAKKKGLNWSRVMDGVLSDGRVSHAHTRVPGPDGQFGFGGTCLPKDIASLAYQISEAGLLNAVTHAARTRNEIDRLRAR